MIDFPSLASTAVSTVAILTKQAAACTPYTMYSENLVFSLNDLLIGILLKISPRQLNRIVHSVYQRFLQSKQEVFKYGIYIN